MFERYEIGEGYPSDGEEIDDMGDVKLGVQLRGGSLHCLHGLMARRESIRICYQCQNASEIYHGQK